MRIAGLFLLLAGFVLCLSVAWAALGFLLMGVGLVALLVAERKQRKAQKIQTADIDPPPEPVAAVAAAPLAAVTDAPVVLDSSPVPVLETAQRAEASAYDKDAWRRLIESEADLAQLNAVLSDYGQHFVDEFATSYLAAPDKGRIASIVDEIIAKATRAKAATSIETAPSAEAAAHPSPGEAQA